METVGIHQARAQFSRLIGRLEESRGFIISRSGKPVAKIVPLDSPEGGPVRRLGFQGQLSVPADFNVISQSDIDALFDG